MRMVSFRIEQEKYEELVGLSQEKGQSISAILRGIVDETLEKEADEGKDADRQ